MAAAHDPSTLGFYGANACAYAEAGAARDHAPLDAFLDQLSPGARMLELGCGAGWDALHMLTRGFRVEAADGCPELAALAEARLGRPVRVLRFDQLEAVGIYDAVWANASLLHTPTAALPDVLRRVRRALAPGGAFAASYKAGEGEGRDGLGRYYNFPTRDGLEAAYAAAGPWRRCDIISAQGGGYDGVRREWLLAHAVRD